MQYNVLVLYLAAAANGFLSYVIIRGKREFINTIFSLFALSAAMWAFFLALFIATEDLASALIYANLYYFFAAAIPVLLLYFSIYFRRERPLSLKHATFIVPWIILCFHFLLDDNIVIKEIFFDSVGNKDVELNLFFYVLYVVYFVFYFLSTYVFLFRKIKEYKQRQETSSQIKLVAWGTLISYVFGMYFNLFLPLVGNYSLIWVGPAFSVFMIGSVGVAIIRYQLFDIRVIATQLFIFLLCGALFVRLLFSFDYNDLVFNSALFLSTLVLGFFLIRSVVKEVKAREQIEKLAKDLRVANERLHKINMLKTEFVSLATHQLRSPLTAIKGYASMLLEGSYGKVEDTMREPLERIVTSTTTLSQVVQDFLDVSRIEQGSMKYDMKAFSFKDLVEEVVMEQGPNIEKSGLDFEFDVQDDSIAQNGYITYGDRSKLKQVIMNLVDNSLKYTKEGFVKVLLTYTSKAIILRIVDSGIGIDEKTLPALFQKFERADGADEVNVQGTGLGLYIARQIIETHDGTISASSEGIGKGSTFTVELKRKEF